MVDFSKGQRGKYVGRELKIELAPQERVNQYPQAMDALLRYLGHPEALITDLSVLSDFNDFGDSRIGMVGKLVALHFDIDVPEDGNLATIAERIHHRRRATPPL